MAGGNERRDGDAALAIPLHLLSPNGYRRTRRSEVTVVHLLAALRLNRQLVQSVDEFRSFTRLWSNFRSRFEHSVFVPIVRLRSDATFLRLQSLLTLAMRLVVCLKSVHAKAELAKFVVRIVPMAHNFDFFDRLHVHLRH